MIELFSINCLLGEMRFSSMARVRTMDVAFFISHGLHSLITERLLYCTTEIRTESESEFGFLLYDTVEACDHIM